MLNQEALNGFEQAAIYCCEGYIVARNIQAEQLFPQWSEGSAIPEALAAIQIPIAGGSVSIGEQGQYYVSTLPDSDGTLYMFQPLFERIPMSNNLRNEISMRNMIGELYNGVQKLYDYNRLSHDKSYAQTANRVSQSIYRMLKQLDEQAIEETSQEPYRSTLVELHQIFEKICIELDGLLPSLNVKLEWKLDGGLIFAQGECITYERLFLYMISWSMKHMQHSARQELSLQLSQISHKTACLSLTDSGTKLSAKDIERIFLGTQGQEFTPDIHTELMLVNRIVSTLGATMLVQSEEESTSVYVYLPLQTRMPGMLKTPQLQIDYFGGFIPSLVILSDVLPPSVYSPLDLD